jgi:hypothetical protein
MKTSIIRSPLGVIRLPAWLLATALVVAFAATSARATTVIAPDFDSLVKGADYVVRAVVKSVTSEYRTTPHGKAIFTKVELQVLGGTVDGITMRVEGVPLFHVGDEDILFVQNNGHQYYPLVGIMNGKYPVKHHPATAAAFIARSNGTPLYDEKDVKQEMTLPLVAQMQHPNQQPLSPTTFADKIRESYRNQNPQKQQLAN